MTGHALTLHRRYTLADMNLNLACQSAVKGVRPHRASDAVDEFTLTFWA